MLIYKLLSYPSVLNNIKTPLIKECDLISGGLNREVPLYTVVSSFQSYNRGVPQNTEVSSFQGIGIEGVPLVVEETSSHTSIFHYYTT